MRFNARSLYVCFAGCVICVCVYLFLIFKTWYRPQFAVRQEDSYAQESTNRQFTPEPEYGHLTEKQNLQLRFINEIYANQKPVYADRNYLIYDKQPIDIGKKTPTLEHLKAQTVIMTGFSKFSENDGLGLIASAQVHMPMRKIIIYNLGMKKKTRDRLKTLCNVEVREFPFQKHPVHIRKMSNHGWRVLAIKDCLDEYGSVYYAHPKSRFRSSIDHLLPHTLENYGITAKLLNRSVVTYSHPGMLVHLGLNLTTFQKQYDNSPIIESDGLLMVRHSTLQKPLWKQVIACVYNKACLSPSGATWNKRRGSVHVHRYDMSALSIIFYKSFLNDWIQNSTVSELMETTHVTITEGNPFMELAWAFQCNPPEKEKILKS